MAWCDVVELRTLRACRIELGQSQAAFAAMLGVSPESYRTWDAGRRATPPKVLARARALATHQDDHKLRAGSPPHARSPTAARWSAARPSSDARRRARRRPRQVRAQPVRRGSFEAPLPPCDAVATSLVLHHVPTMAPQTQALCTHLLSAPPRRRLRQRRRGHQCASGGARGDVPSMGHPSGVVRH